MRVSFASLVVFMASIAMTTMTIDAFGLRFLPCASCASSRQGHVSLDLSFYNNGMDSYMFVHDEDGDDVVDDDDDDDVLFKTLGEDLPATFRNFQPSIEKMWELPAESWAADAGGAPMAPPEGMFMEIPSQFAHLKSPKQQQSQTEQPMLGGFAMPQSLPTSMHHHQHHQQQQQQQQQQHHQQPSPTPQQQQDKSFLPDSTMPPKIRGLEEPRFGW